MPLIKSIELTGKPANSYKINLDFKAFTEHQSVATYRGINPINRSIPSYGFNFRGFFS
jgi:hypothetical protein